ncbi:hypothetical protein [Massilia sp. GCM10023247]
MNGGPAPGRIERVQAAVPVRAGACGRRRRGFAFLRSNPFAYKMLQLN